MLPQGKVVRVQLLIGWGIYYLGVYLLLVVVLGQSSPVYIFSTAGWETDAMDIESIELGCFFRWATSKWNLSDLKLWFLVIQYLLRLLLSILLSIITSQTFFLSTQIILKFKHLNRFIQLSLFYFFGLIKIKMSHIRKHHKYQKKDKHDLGIQSEPSNQEANPQTTHQNIIKDNVLPHTHAPMVKAEKVDNLIGNLEKVENQSKILNEKLKSQVRQPQKIVRLNMMKLQDKNFNLDKNIYNIAVGQLFSKETYLSNLTQKIEQLRGRVRQLQDQEQMMSKTIQFDQTSEKLLERSRTIDERKSQCGRIYSRGATPHSQRRSLKFNNKESERSSFYKWKPEIDEQCAVSESNTKQMVRSGKNRYNHESNTPQLKNQEKDKEYIRYRVKQKSARPPLSSKDGRSSISGQKSKHMTELQERQRFQSEQLSCSKTSKTEQKFTTEKGFRQSKQLQNNYNTDKNSLSEEPQEEELEQYSGNIFKDTSEFEIKDLTDDFRDKVIKQLQIPQGFPVDAPELGLIMEQIQNLGKQIFSIFGVNLEKEKSKMISRKFKNGVYYHLGADKNILWYYSGSFYLGGWDTNLPTEGQKTGFGLEYIPGKYHYLGQFSNGVKHGKGSIKIFSPDPNTPEEFMAYEGSWSNGKPHGCGKHIDEKGTKYIGDFLAGEKTGKAKILTEQGIFYEGQVKKGIKNGQGYQKLLNEDTFTGSFLDGMFHGQGVYKWKTGSRYEGQFFKGKRQGKGEWKSNTGDLFEGDYFDDLKNGWGKFTWLNGQIYQGEFKDDVRHGQGTYRHPNGKMGRFMWKQGKIDYRLYSKQEQNYRQRKIEENKDEPEQQQFQQ